MVVTQYREPNLPRRPIWHSVCDMLDVTDITKDMYGRVRNSAVSIHGTVSHLTHIVPVAASVPHVQLPLLSYSESRSSPMKANLTYGRYDEVQLLERRDDDDHCEGLLEHVDLWNVDIVFWIIALIVPFFWSHIAVGIVVYILFCHLHATILVSGVVLSCLMSYVGARAHRKVQADSTDCHLANLESNHEYQVYDKLLSL